MLVRVIVWTVGVVLGVIAVVSTNQYIELATGYRIVDFIPWETNGESQRLYRARMGQLAMMSAAGCLASFMFAFSRRSR
jgi:hypothetical protein